MPSIFVLKFFFGKKLLTAFAVCCLLSLKTNAQTKETLQMRAGSLVHRFYYNGEKISKWGLKSMMYRQDSASFNYFRKAMRSSLWEITTGIGGGILLGLEGANITFVGDINYLRLGSGIALAILNTYFYYRKKKNYILSVLTFNKYFRLKEEQASIDFGVTVSGGLGFKFNLSKPARPFAY